jgi:hypothetical protein
VRSLAPMTLAVFQLLVALPALAQDAAAPAPPELRQRASVNTVDGLVLFKPGELLVGNPELQGRPAVRPLEGSELAQVPEQLDDYVILSAGCLDAPGEPHEPSVISDEVLARGDLGGDGRLEQVVVERRSPMAAPDVLVSRDGLIVGQGELPIPAVPCRGLVAEAEPEGDPVLLLIWTSRGANNTTVGVTVFELDEPAPAGD